MVHSDVRYIFERRRVFKRRGSWDNLPPTPAFPFSRQAWLRHWCVCPNGCCVLTAVNACSLSDLPVHYQRKITARLPTTLPLHVTAGLIDDADTDYWRRCCRAQYSTPADVQLYGGSWKRMMLERTIKNIIENYVPVPAHCERLDVSGQSHQWHHLSK